jgi:hypothetical protein
MLVGKSSLSLSATHQLDVSEEHSEKLETWVGTNHRNQQSVETYSSSRVSISDAARLAFRLAGSEEKMALPAPVKVDKPEKPVVATVPQATSNNAASEVDPADETADSDPKVSMIRRMLEILTGKTIRVFSMRDLSGTNNADAAPVASGQASSQTAQSLADQSAPGAIYQRHDIYQETESTSFSAEGTVQTADGASISFKLSIQMQSTVVQESSVEARFGVALRDPLVINFSGSAPQLLDQHFQFDFNGDGTQKDLPLLGAGSGFLTFDRNGNGQVDSGRELFGPVSNNGFAELAQLDSDGNGWLDEADPAFKQLGVWRPSANKDAPGQWQTLAEAGIGALALAHTVTPFALRNGNQAAQGQLRESGVALTEKGQALAVQEVDLAV